MPTANMFMMDWNEETPDNHSWKPNTTEDLISEGEIGKENFQRYKTLSAEDQKLARTKYRKRLLDSDSTKESSEKRVLLPDGMRGYKVS